MTTLFDPVKLGDLELANRIGLAVCKANFTGPLILNDSISLERGNEMVDSGEAAAVSFARYYLSNPDLVRRFGEGAELARFDRKTLYTPGPAGYTDYPFLRDPQTCSRGKQWATG